MTNEIDRIFVIVLVVFIFFFATGSYISAKGLLTPDMAYILFLIAGACIGVGLWYSHRIEVERRKRI